MRMDMPIAWILSAVAVGGVCMTKAAGEVPEDDAGAVAAVAPAEAQASIERFAEDLAHICLADGRRVGTAGHDQVLGYLEQRLTALGLVPYAGDSFRLPYERERISFTNLIGVVPGRDRALAPVLIGAHYDSVIDAPCADDNAAAVCIALAAARRIVAEELTRDVVIALFDAEEPPHFLDESMGSIRFREDQADDRGFHAAFALDLVGHDVALPLPGGEALADLLFVTGAESHPDLAAIVGPRTAQEGLRIVAALNRYVGDMSDHHIFRTTGVPYLFLSCGRWEHYHQPSDTVDRLNLAKMERITTWLVEVAKCTAAAGLRGEPPDDDFTLDLECRSIGAALALLDPKVLGALGITPPQTRPQMNQVAQALLRSGL